MILAKLLVTQNRNWKLAQNDRKTSFFADSVVRWVDRMIRPNRFGRFSPKLRPKLRFRSYTNCNSLYSRYFFWSKWGFSGSVNILFVTVEKTLNKVYLVAALEPHFTNPLLILDRFWKTTTRSTFLVSHSIAFFAKGTMTNFKPYWSWLLSEIHTFLQFYRLPASVVHKQPTFSNKNVWSRLILIFEAEYFLF